MFSRGLLREYPSLLSGVARTADVVVVTAAALIAFYVRFGTFSMPVMYKLGVLISVFLVIGVFSNYGVYRSWRGKDRLFQAQVVTAAWVTVLFLLIVVAFLTKTSTMISRQWLVEWSLIGWGLLLLSKLLLTIGIQELRGRGWNQKHIVVIGAGELGREVIRRIKDSPWMGLEIAGVFEDNQDTHKEEVEGIRVLGSITDIAAFLKERLVDEVWITMPLKEEDRMIQLILDLEQFPVDVRMVPDIFGFRLLNHSLTEVAGLPVVNLTVTPMDGLNRIIKAFEDRFLSIFILILISPLMALIAIGVKLSSRGPVFYRQERVGWNGQPFMMLKFRSMPINVERETGAVWAKKGEMRATPFGAFLRRTSLDELPQFINVLKGEMSIVGPRPERPIFVDRFRHEIPGYMKKHLVKAGITGWAQINGWRGDTDLKKRIECDLYYIDHWSLWMDIKIIFLTVVRGFIHRNAY